MRSLTVLTGKFCLWWEFRILCVLLRASGLLFLNLKNYDTQMLKAKWENFAVSVGSIICSSLTFLDACIFFPPPPKPQASFILSYKNPVNENQNSLHMLFHIYSFSSRLFPSILWFSTPCHVSMCMACPKPNFLSPFALSTSFLSLLPEFPSQIAKGGPWGAELTFHIRPW